MNIRQWLFLAALPLCFGCKSPGPKPTQGSTESRPTNKESGVRRGETPSSQVDATQAEGSQGRAPSPAIAKTTNSAPFLRVGRPRTNISELQVSVRQFTSADRSQPVVWLAGVSHVGETNY